MMRWSEAVDRWRKVQQRRGFLLLAALLLLGLSVTPVVILFQEEVSPAACCWRASIVVCASDNCGACGCDYTCDGTDDQEQINAAVADLVTCGTGGDIMLTEGTFILSDSVLLVDDITLRGSGGATKLVWAEDDNAFIAITNDAHDAGAGTDYRMVVRDLMLDGDEKGYGIYFEDAFDSTIENVWVTDAKYGVWLDDVDRSNVLTSWVYSCADDGFTALNCDSVGLNGCYLYDNTGEGGYFSASTNCALEGLQVSYNGSYGLFFTGASNFASLVRNQVHHNTANGIALANSSWGLVANNEVYLNGGNGILLTGFFGSPACSGNEILGNNVYQNSQSADNVQSNILAQNIMGTMTGNQISANHSYADTSTANRPQYCIAVPSATNTMIEGNMAMNIPRPAQDMSTAGSTNSRVRDNVGIDGAGAAEWLAESSPAASPSVNYRVYTEDGVVHFFSRYIDVPFSMELLEGICNYSWLVEWAEYEKTVRIAVPGHMPLADFLGIVGKASGEDAINLSKSIGSYLTPESKDWPANLRSDVSMLNVGTSDVAYYYIEHPTKYAYTLDDVKAYMNTIGWVPVR